MDELVRIRNKILLSFATIISLDNLLPVNLFNRRKGALSILILGSPILPLFLEIPTFFNATIKILFLIHIILFFGLNYYCVAWTRKRILSLSKDEKNQFPLEWAGIVVLLVQIIQGLIHYLLFKSYQMLLIKIYLIQNFYF